MVRVTGLEPARRGHQNLNLARLPIPPYPRVRLVYPFCGYLSILMMVLIGSGALAKRAESALTPRGRTRGSTPAVSTLLRITPFPWIAWRRPETGDRCEIRGTAVGVPLRGFLRLFAVHRYTYGQLTLCRSCVKQPVCVAAKYLALRRGKEMGAHCAPLR